MASRAKPLIACSRCRSRRIGRRWVRCGEGDMMRRRWSWQRVGHCYRGDVLMRTIGGLLPLVVDQLDAVHYPQREFRLKDDSCNSPKVPATPGRSRAGAFSCMKGFPLTVDCLLNSRIIVVSDSSPELFSTSSSAPDKPRILSRPQKTLQEVMFKEALAALPVIAPLSNLNDLRPRLAESLPQNGAETRIRYADSMIRWFFRDGLQGLALATWRTYGDQGLQLAVHRYLYLSIEPIVAQCVGHVLSKLNDGIVVPEGYLAGHTEKLLGHPLVELTRKRLLSNLRKLGFLDRQAAGDRLTPVQVNKTGLLLALHYEFAREELRTVSFASIAANPFWRFFGVRTEDDLRDFLREADHTGLLGKYVVADRLEQVTPAYTLAELLQRKALL